MNKKQPKTLGTYAGFITDVVKAMNRHEIGHAVMIFGLNDQLRNAYMTTSGEEDPLYCKISDAFNEWLSQGAETKGGAN